MFDRSQDEDFFSPTLVLFSAFRLIGVLFADEDLGVDEGVDVGDDGFEHVLLFPFCLLLVIGGDY